MRSPRVGAAATLALLALLAGCGGDDSGSDSSASRYDAHCGYADALTPAPEAGTWFQAYFETLLRNAAF